MIKYGETRKVEELKFYPGNPRKISSSELEKLKKSLKEFGVVDPLVINTKNQVIGGNQRLTALKTLGVETVPVVIVDFPESKEKALNLALNRIQGEWDYAKLSAFLADIDKEDLELTGFEDTELELYGIEAEAEKAIDEFVGGEENEEVEPVQNAVVYLSFENLDDANAWLEKNGFKERLRSGTSTLVVDMSKYEW